MNRTREFNLALLGYDRRQVDAFTEEVDALVDQLQQQVVELTDDLDELRQAKPITAEQAFANVARETQRILQAARDAGSRMVSEARAQADDELANARRERSQIASEGYRARDELSAQLRQLDDARVQLARRLQEAAAEVERVTGRLDVESARPVDLAPQASTGTDAARARTSGATLRVITSGDTTARRTRRSAPTGVDGDRSIDPFAGRRDALAPLRLAMIDRLTVGVRSVRDQLRERVRQISDGDASADVVVDAATFDAVTQAGTVQLRQAFTAGARAAAPDRRSPTPAPVGEDVGRSLADALEEVVAAPIRALLSAGMAAHDPPWVLAERLDGVVSDASITGIVETELSRAYESGKLATWIASDMTARRWAVAPHGHRLDEACRRDAAVGPVAVSQSFPSGEHTPPRQDGCTCTTVAVDEENST